MSGGGGQPQGPSQQTVTQSNVPEYARPYVEQTLGKANALTDINKNPYQIYQGERIAGFSPLQQQAFQGAQDLGPTGQTGMASQLAGTAGLGALNTQYGPSGFQGGVFGQGAAQHYMSPYIQQSLAPQLMEAQRQSDIAGQTRGAQAVKSGAFGGARQAIENAEAQRNLSTLQSNIVGQGLQSAYTNAQGQFNADAQRGLAAQQATEQSRQFGANLGMQGYQTALQGAGQLGQLGQQTFEQQKGAVETQQAMGAAQQAQDQAKLTQGYQDFIAQKNYPYQQLLFMSDLLRGTPSSSSTATYQAPPSALSQLAGAGTAAYGLNTLLKAKGGTVTSKSKRKSAGLGHLAVSKMAS